MRSRGIAASACAALLAFACDDRRWGEGPDRVRPIVVGVAQGDWSEARTRSLQQEAERRKIELVFADATGQQEGQMRALKSFIARDVDVIVLAPLVETGWDAVLAEVRAAEIPVVVVERGVSVADESLYATWIASGSVESEAELAPRVLDLVERLERGETVAKKLATREGPAAEPPRRQD